MVIIQKRNVLKCWISAIKQMNLDSVHLSGSTVWNQHQELHGGWDECSEILDSDRLVVVISPAAVWGMCNCVNRAAAGRPEYNPWQQADLSFVLSWVTTRVSWPAHLPRRQTLILRHSIRDGKPTLWRGTCTVGDMNRKSINGTVLLCG